MKQTSAQTCYMQIVLKLNKQLELGITPSMNSSSLCMAKTFVSAKFVMAAAQFSVISSNNMLLKNLFEIQNLDLENVEIIKDDIGIDFEIELEIPPREFLEFAEIDLQESSRRGLVNSLSNLKRAIDAQVQVVLKAFNIQADKLKKPKITLLNDMGIVAPRIIKKIRDIRNILEHEYTLPTLARLS